MANKVTIEVEADPQGTAQATFNNLTNTVNQFAQNTAKAGASASQSFSIADKDVEKLRAELERTRDAAQRLEIQFLKTATARGASSPIGSAASAQAAEARKLAEAAGVGLGRLDAGGVTQAGFTSITRGAGEAKNVLKDLGQEKLKLDRTLAQEPPPNDRFFSTAQSILFRDVIKDTIRYAIQLGQSLLASYQEATAAQQQLIVSSIDYGQQIEANIRAARELAVTNQGAVTGTEAQKVQAVALTAAGKTGQPAEAARISQAALDLAAKRLPDTADAAKILQQYLQGSSAAAEALVGPFSTDEHVLQRFADATHRSAKELTEQERILARIQELERRGGLFPGAAAERAQLIGVQVDKATSSLEGYAEVIARHRSLQFLAFAAFGGVPALAAQAEALNLGLARQPTTTQMQPQRDAQIGAQEQALGAADAAREDARKRVQKQLEDFQERLNATTGDPHLPQRQSGLQNLQSEFRALESELQRFPELIGQSGINKIGDRLGNSLEKTTQEIARQQEEALKKLATVRVEAISLIDTLSAKAAHDNPFVKLFSDGDKAIESIRLKFAPLGNEFVEQMVRMQQAVTATDLALARFDANQTALKYRQEARRLREPVLGLTGPEDRQLDVLKGQVAAAVNVPRLAAERDALLPSHQFRYAFEIAREQKRIFDDQLRELQSLQSLAGGAFGRASNKIIDEQVLSLTGQIDPRVLARSPDPIIRAAKEARQGALSRGIEGYQEDIREAIARARAGERLQQDAREQLKLLAASHLPQDEAVKRFLSITGQLSDKELTGDLRLGRARVLDIASQRESAKEQAAEATRKTLDGVLKKLDGLLTEKGLKVDGDGGSVAIEVADRSDSASVSVLGPGFGPGFRE
jgi:hypothetical protein